MNNHFPRHSLKVPDSIISTSVLEMCIHSTVYYTLSHSLVVLDERVFCKFPVVAVVVLYSYVETFCVPLETFLDVYNLL